MPLKGGSSLLDAIGMKKKPAPGLDDAEESSQDMGGGGGEEEDSDAVDMALEDFCDALDLDGDKREEAISALKNAIEAAVSGGGGKGGL